MNELLTTLQRKKYKILLIGDSCIDRYVYGTCERLNPEAPVPILSIDHITETPGMAANVCANLTALGADVDFMTGGTKSIKTRYIDKRSGQHIIRVDEDKQSLPFYVYSDSMYNQYDAIVISDYCKGYITYENVEILRELYSGPIFIDTKKHELNRLKGCIIKVNDHEFALAKYDYEQKIIVTCGDKPTTLIKGSVLNHFPVKQAEVVDVCGAGDTFIAAFSLAHLATGDYYQSIPFAIAASSVTVQHQGVYAPTLKEIIHE